MKKALYETLENIANNTLADNSMSNFMIRNLATNIGISNGAANARVGKLVSTGFVRTETVGQGILVAITDIGRKVLTDEQPEVRTKPRNVGTREPSKSLPEGYVLLKDFVDSPSAARRKLRALNEPKPCSQWAWPKSDIERIKQLVGES